MVAGTKHRDPVLGREERASLSEREDVMNMQGTLAASGEVRERALGVVSEDARTEVAPAGSVVQNGHDRSLSTILSTRGG